MKNKLSFLALLLVGLTPLAQAQLAGSKVLVAPEVGITGNYLQQRVFGNDFYTTPTVGARLGLMFDVPISDRFSLQPSVAFVLNDGGRTDLKRNFKTGAGIPTTITDERTYHANVVHFPILFTYRTDGQYATNHYTFGVGPYGSVAVGGRFKQDFTTLLNGEARTNRFDRQLKKGDVLGEDDLRYFDFGATAAVGMETPSGFNVKLYYNYGIANRAPGDNSNDNKYKSMSAALTVSYFVNKPQQQSFR